MIRQCRVAADDHQQMVWGLMMSDLLEVVDQLKGEAREQRRRISKGWTL